MTTNTTFARIKKYNFIKNSKKSSEIKLEEKSVKWKIKFVTFLGCQKQSVDQLALRPAEIGPTQNSLIVSIEL